MSLFMLSPHVILHCSQSGLWMSALDHSEIISGADDFAPKSCAPLSHTHIHTQKISNSGHSFTEDCPNMGSSSFKNCNLASYSNIFKTSLNTIYHVYYINLHLAFLWSLACCPTLIYELNLQISPENSSLW